MSSPTAVSADVALMALQKRIDLADQMIAATEEGTPLRLFADQLKVHCRTAIVQVKESHDPQLVASRCGLAGLIAGGGVDSASFIILADLVALLGGHRLPERGSHV